MIKRVFRCTLHPTRWHWELVCRDRVVYSGTRESRAWAHRAADSRRREGWL